MPDTLDGLSPVRQALAALPPDVAIMKVTYHGSGDSGDVGDVELTDKDGNSIENPENIFDTAWILVDEYVNSNHSGWENNDGAEGEIEVDVINGTWSLEHREFYTQSNDYSHSGELS